MYQCMKKITFLFILSQIVITLDVIAQNDSIAPLSTDRPTYSIAPNVVPKRTFQVETGFLFEKESTDLDDIDNLYLGMTLLRYGLFQNFEIRLEGTYRQMVIQPNDESPDSTISGLGAVKVGLKFNITEEKGIVPNLGFVADITLRHIGKDGFHPTYSYSAARFVAANTLSKNFSLGYNLGFAYNGENADGFFIWSVVLNYTMFNSISLFAETYGTFDNNNLPHNDFDAGIVWQIRHNMQVDITAGTSFSSSVSFVNAGFSWRLPR